MAGNDEIVIKINGDLKNYQEALTAAGKKTEEFSETLKDGAKYAGIAFAALTAEVGLSVYAFAESEKATNQLTAKLQSQGIYSKALAEDYQKQATELQNLTGISDEATLAAQTAIQSYLGETAVSKELTLAIANLATAKGMDLVSAANLVGKAIDGNSAMLKRYGVEVDDNASKQERLSQVINGIEGKFRGQAEAAAQGVGSIKILKEAFSGLQEEIGSKFAPAVELAIKVLTKIIQFANDHKGLTDFGIAMFTAGLAITGAATAATAAGFAFLKIKAAMDAAKIATSLMTIATKGLTAATGLGLIILLGTEIYLNWKTIWPAMQAVFISFVQNVGMLASGFANILKGTFTLDKSQIEKGLDEIKQSFVNGFEDLKKEYTEAKEEQAKIEAAGEKKKTDANDAGAAERFAKREQQQQRERNSVEAEKDLQLLKQEEASAELVALKQKESEALKLVADEKFQGDKEALETRAQELRGLQDEQRAIDAERDAAYNDQILANNEEYNAMTEAQQDLFDQQNEQKLIQTVETKKTIKAKLAQDELAQDIKDNNKFLTEQEKYGSAYAMANAAVNSAVFKGNKQAFGELAQLQQSSNSTLKGIGKAAALANIVIKTAESALNIYAGFSTIPIVGPILGVAGAAAAVAFGAEQFGKVSAAADGALVSGGIPGKDSVPYMLEPGELVVPKRNFEEVVGGVQNQRGGGDNQMLAILQSIDAKLSQPSNITNINGDVMADESYIQTLISKIRDQLQYNNAVIIPAAAG